MMSAFRTQERIDFILKRVRIGLARSDILKQFSAEFGVAKSQTWNWYNRALDSLVVTDPLEGKRTRAGIIEIFHAQIVACQSDLKAIDREIEKIEGYRDSRSLLFERLAQTGDKTEKDSIRQELESIPRLSALTLTKAIESKGRVRDRIVDLCTQLARVHGLYQPDMDWVRAANVLAESGLLPRESAADILDRLSILTDRPTLGSPADEWVEDFN